ncbi:MAG: class I SAM-dependent methyltransferase [Pseudomonadota bacterium]
MEKNISILPGHEVLAMAGKTILRPGGLKATEQLFSWAGFEKQKTLLELASSFGHNLEVLSNKFGLVVTGIDKNESSVHRAREKLKNASKPINIAEGDILNLDEMNGTFDYVLAEAILTMQSDNHRKKIIESVYRKLNDDGEILIHELVFKQDEKALHKKLSQVIKVNANAMTESGWKSLLTESGFTINEVETGPMSLLTPDGLLRDEGFFGIMRIMLNVMTNVELRKRILDMRHFFHSNADKLSYIIISARKQGVV